MTAIVVSMFEMARTRGCPRAIVAAAVLWSWPLTADAGNTVHPRTPVQWPEAACIQTVDRSIDPVFEFSYSIPLEDLEVTTDELDDSRRHQFIAFCEHWHRASRLPNYVSIADRQRAIDAGLEDADVGANEVLESGTRWPRSCWVRVTPDDSRRLISFEAAAEPVRWDTRDVAPGVYRIAGYTWEPPLNLWSGAPWAVRVVDGSDHDIVPAVVVGSLPVGIAHDETLPVEVCMDAPEGSRVELAWALKQEDPQFEVLGTTDYNGAAVELEFVPPEASWGESVLVAVTVETPQGLRYTGHGPRELLVFAEPREPEGSMTTGSGGEPEASSSESGAGASSGGAPEQRHSSGGSGCSASRPSTETTRLGLFALIGLAVGARRRRVPRTRSHHRPSRRSRRWHERQLR